MTILYRDLALDWWGYATLRLEVGETTVYVDPGRYGVLTGEWEADSADAQAHHPPGRDRRPQDGDVVCISHVHHYDPDGIERVAKSDATVVLFEGINVDDSGRDLQRPVELPFDIRAVDMEDELVESDVMIWTVPAYNERDGPHTAADGQPYHPEGFGCAFVITLEGNTVFWPGDTDVLEGHDELDADVFCPPIGGSFTMDRHEAADLVAEMRPGLVVPIHYNTFDALETDSRAFAADVAESGIPVALDEH